MNEHTKLLIMKAGGIICSTEGSAVVDKIDYLHFDAEKFAELIVRECLLELADVRLEHVFDTETDNVFGIAIDRIKTTFRS